MLLKITFEFESLNLSLSRIQFPQNNIEVVNLSTAEFDQMLISDKDTKDSNGIR